jgi:hypothetical protein
MMLDPKPGAITVKPPSLNKFLKLRIFFKNFISPENFNE